ncbi:hypothetical protein AB0K37_40605, partial [Actinomadura sp. NPDC049753]
MNIVIAGGHGQIALRLSRLLAARGDTVLSIIRNPGHAGDVRDTPIIEYGSSSAPGRNDCRYRVSAGTVFSAL